MATPFDTITRPATTGTPARPRQTELLRQLMVEKAELQGIDFAERANEVEGWLGTLSADSASVQISRAIAWLKEARKARRGGHTAPRNDLPGADVVPEGRYAIPTVGEGATNDLAFYKVDRPTEGRWAGYVFVKQLIGPDEQRQSRAATASILARIAEVGAKEASAAYGHEIGHCGVCGLRLTNDESRERGIGPVCFEKMGW